MRTARSGVGDTVNPISSQGRLLVAPALNAGLRSPRFPNPHSTSFLLGSSSHFFVVAHVQGEIAVLHPLLLCFAFRNVDAQRLESRLAGQYVAVVSLEVSLA